jgi:hypothetical protein
MSKYIFNVVMQYRLEYKIVQALNEEKTLQQDK